jgi:hypothetical protein
MATKTKAIETVVLAALVAACGSFLILLLLSPFLGTRPAFALPSFAVQTSQPCANCHVGAFGPQLKPAGRDFKLHGYVGSDGKDHGLPIAWETKTSFTHTLAPQPGGAAPGFKPNDNFAVDELSMFYAGRITPQSGAFVEFNFNGVARQPGLGAVDIRHVRDGELFGKDVLYGITFNNRPTVQDPWNSTPAWGFPYNRSSLAPTPMASTLIDGGLDSRVVGVGGYMLWNDLLYAEFDIYKGLDAYALRRVDQVPIDDGNRTTSFIPYARLAVIKDLGQHHAQIGAYGLTANVVPGGGQTLGFRTHVTDVGFDANYQFIFDTAKTASDMISAHATFIHEDSSMGLDAQTVTGALGRHSLDTFRADVSYSIGATVTPSMQYFQTTGTMDPSYWSTSNGSPNSAGMIYEVAYVPWGKPDSPFNNFNLRLAVQYIDYFRFDGTSVDAKNNNHYFFSLQTAVKF